MATKISRNAILFNGAAVLVAGASLAYALHSTFIGEEAAPCTARYAQGMRMSLERDGAPLAGADLQARFGGSDWGVLDRSRAVKLKSGAAPFALEVDLTGAKADDRDETNGREGVGFLWAPRSFAAAESACLSYAVFMPEGFEYGGGGRLPGLMGLKQAEEGADQGPVAFSTRYAWREDGAGDIHSQIPTFPEGRSLGNDKKGFAFPRGRWVELQQEVVLNGPKQKNGIMRVWVDGNLRFEKTNVVFREVDARITGVLAEVVPMGRDVDPKAKAQKLWMTPFELRWN